ncbi:hypothetical protein Egran_02583 [Elaphomyces granulatus]|uniref:Uncharacterized protein n=1 Tax=Elaphomyces granulatus TaxID=519963 RepID=A0A232LZS8_9EURO|nr:hypothetical protein Egran_02583 [Elaphomyces granulatus]
MSLASILVGIASYWTPMLARRSTRALIIEGDLVIRVRQGAFIIIQCTEEVAREIFTGPEACLYLTGSAFSTLLVWIATILVMTSIVLFGNCNWTMQAVIMVIYSLLNGLYCGVLLLPKRWFWDMSRYHCDARTHEECK